MKWNQDRTIETKQEIKNLLIIAGAAFIGIAVIVGCILFFMAGAASASSSIEYKSKVCLYSDNYELQKEWAATSRVSVTSGTIYFIESSTNNFLSLSTSVGVLLTTSDTVCPILKGNNIK